MTDVKRLTTAQVSKICDRSQRTILRWVANGMFSDIRRVQDGYLFMSNSTVSCFTKADEGKDVPMTLAEIALDVGVEI